MYRSSIERGTTITGTLLGNLLVGIAMVGWMIWIIRSKTFSKEFTPLEIAGVSCLVSFFVSIILAILEIIITKPTFILTPDIVLAGLYLGAGGTFLTYLLYQYAISKVSSFSASLTSYLQPVATTVFASYFIGEKVNTSFFIGGMMVLLGVFVTQVHLVKRYLDRR
jgi:drug/metabolite transporter (DMT)-like permease